MKIHNRNTINFNKKRADKNMIILYLLINIVTIEIDGYELEFDSFEMSHETNQIIVSTGIFKDGFEL